MVGYVYWEENDLDRIVKYCIKDVITIAQLLRRYQGMKLLADENIEVN